MTGHQALGGSEQGVLPLDLPPSVLPGPPPVIEAFPEERPHQGCAEVIEELQKRPLRQDVEWLADYIESRAKAQKEASVDRPSYSIGLSTGMATAFELCANWIRDDLLK